MGAYSPAVQLSGAVHQDILHNIIRKDDLGYGGGRAGLPRRAVRWPDHDAGMDPESSSTNARFGDPEAQPVLARLRSDIVPALTAITTGQLADIHLDWREELQ